MIKFVKSQSWDQLIRMETSPGTARLPSFLEIFMRKVAASLIAAMIIFGLAAFAIPHFTQKSVCTLTGLTGFEQIENVAYCHNVNIAPSTYKAVIALAGKKHILCGTPMFVYETYDAYGKARTAVDFTRGCYAEHYNFPDPNHTIYIYTGPKPNTQMWPDPRIRC